MKKINFAIIGCGRIYGRHAEAINKLSNTELVAVSDIDDKKLQQAVNKYGCDGYLDYKNMLKRDDIDVVCICTPSGLHYDMCMDSCKARKHIIVEKPMAMNIKQAKLMTNMCKFCKIKLFVIKQNRYNKPIIKLKDTIEKQKLGKLFLGNVTVRWARPDAYYDQDEWRGSRAQDGSVLYNQASHHIDMLCWLLGPVESVVGFCKNMTHKSIEVEDTGIAMLKFTNGAFGTIEATTSIYDKNLEGSISIFGATGSVKVGGTSMNKIETWNIKGKKEDMRRFNENPPDVYGYGHIEYYKDVAKCIRQNIEPVVDGHEGLKSLKVIEAIYKSIELGGKEIFLK